MPRVEINGRVVEFAQMPTPEDIDHVAASFGTTAPAATPAPQAPAAPGIFGTIGRALEGPAGLQEAVMGGGLRQNAPLLGQVAGGLAGTALSGGAALPALLGLLGGIGGSAIQRGGVPTTGDVATAAAGEALPLVPGAGRAVSRLVGGRLAPQAMGRVAQASRFGIPMSAVEAAEGPIAERVVPSLARNPLSSRYLLRAGRAQSSGIQQAGQAIADRWFGGTLPALEFGARARKGILQTAQRLTPGKGPEIKAAAQQLAGDTLDKAALAGAVAKSPMALVDVMKSVGEQGMQDLRAAWWTGVFESATEKAGTRRGLVDPRRIVSAWDNLAGKGASDDAARMAQAALFGNRAQHVRAFVDTLRTAKTAAEAGSRIHIPHRWRWEIPAAIAGTLTGHPGVAAGEIAVEAAAPWIAARLLVSAPPGAVGQFLRPVAPSAARATAQAFGQEIQGENPAP